MVRTWKAHKLARDAHILERAEVVTSQDTERLQANKGHLLSGEDRGWNLFECYNKASQ